MSCRLLFVRHGQSLGNLTGRFLGITDLDLSPLGAVQARRTADYLKDEKIDVIYASDLIRACHTAQPLSGNKGAAHNKRQAFRGDKRRSLGKQDV